MGDRRCTIYLNKNPSEGKAMYVDGSSSLKDFLNDAGAKLGIKAKKLYLVDGGEVDDIRLIRDDDVVYVSAGEPFNGQGARGKSSNQSPMFSIAVMGPGSVGKSAITLQYVQGVFVVDYDPTIEDAYRKNVAVDGQACILDILDTAGQEDYTALRSTWMRERDGFVLVFSVTADETFADLQVFYDQLVVMHEENMPPLILVGNKADLENQRTVSKEEGQKRAAEYGAVKYIETSAKTGHNIELMFTELVREIRKGSKSKQAESTKKKKKRSWCTIL